MNWLAKFFFYAKSLFLRKRLDAQLAEEVRIHVEMATEASVAKGMTPEEARYAALREFGNVAGVQERTRDEHGWVWLEQAGQDLRYSARALRKAPGFTFAVVATLSVGIGLLTAVINVSQPILRPDIPFPEPDRLVILRERAAEMRGGYYPLLPFRFASYARHSNSFTALGSERRDALNVVVNGEPFAVLVSSVTNGFFAALGLDCERGRLFLPEEYEPGRAGETVVLSHAAWTKFFGQDPAVLDRDVRVGDRSRRVIGILPAGFKTRQLFADSGGEDGVYLSAAYEPVPARLTRSYGVNVAGRLKPGVTREQAEAELATIHPEMPPKSSDFYTKAKPWLLSAADAFREFRAVPFKIFLGAAGCLYLIGCTAVANLGLSRAVARRRELGVRLALGGSRRRIMGLILAEALLLALLSGLGGALVASWAQNLMSHLAPKGVSEEELLTHAVYGRTFGIGFCLGMLTCVLSAVIPAWRASRVSLNEALKEGAGSLGDSRRLRFLRGTFVVAQGALAVTLLTGTGLMLKSVYRLQHIDLGFVPEHKLVLMGSRTGQVDRNRLESINNAINERLAAVPGVASAALTTSMPAAGYMAMTLVKMEGDKSTEDIQAYGFGITPGYFDTMQLPLVAGRGFDGMHPGDRLVAVIDEVTARQYFPNESPIGRVLLSGKDRLEIVGVAQAVSGGRGGKQLIKRGGKEVEVTAQIYTPVWQSRPSERLNAIVRLHQGPGPEFGTMLRRAVFAIDPSVVLTIMPLDEVVGDWSRQQRQMLVMLQVLSVLALGLAVFGLFSVTAYAVAQRHRELGLRLVLGATPAGLMVFVLRRGLQLGGLGVCIGLAAAAALSRVMQGILYETSPHEPLIYVAVAGLLLFASLLACWLPARRAAKVDPMVALRAE